MTQATLFGHTPQPRIDRGEPDKLYAVIVQLREAGFCVTRSGRRTHTVKPKMGQGRARRFDHAGLIAFAEAVAAW